MIEILFRGKRVDTGEWVYGDLIHGVGFKKGNMYILPIRENLAYAGSGCDPLDGFNVIPESVGQFTGRLDKNKTKIFEGDIVFCNWADEGRGVVFFCKKRCSYRVKSRQKTYSLYAGVTDILGNIHDNPKLL